LAGKAVFRQSIHRVRYAEAKEAQKRKEAKQWAETNGGLSACGVEIFTKEKTGYNTPVPNAVILRLTLSEKQMRKPQFLLTGLSALWRIAKSEGSEKWKPGLNAKNAECFISLCLTGFSAKNKDAEAN